MATPVELEQANQTEDLDPRTYTKSIIDGVAVISPAPAPMSDLVERLRRVKERKEPLLAMACADEIERLTARVTELEGVLNAAAATLGAVYQWLDRVEQAGGATSIAGVAACHSMLKSLRNNALRVEKLVMEPARAALTKPTPMEKTE